MPRKKEDQAPAEAISRRMGLKLRQLRRAGDRTQDDIARAIGLTAEAYARIERGHSLPSFPTLMRLCDTLETTPDELLLDLPTGASADERTAARNGNGAIPGLLADLRHADPRLARDVARLVRTVRGLVNGTGGG